jgi:fructose-1,6-bisphosphatase/inositol monophosphatase family enzyme
MLQWKIFAVDLARKAGVLLKEKFSQKHDIHYKGEINLVTEADKMSDDLITTAIRQTFPDHGILSEESPAIVGGGKLRWIIDPLDGTTNYAHGYPVFLRFYCLSERRCNCFGCNLRPIKRGNVCCCPRRRSVFKWKEDSCFADA